MKRWASTNFNRTPEGWSTADAARDHEGAEDDPVGKGAGLLAEGSFVTAFAMHKINNPDLGCYNQPTYG